METKINLVTTLDDLKTIVTSPVVASNKNDAFPFEIDPRFEYCRELGQGGGGRVCLVYDHKLQRQVALKFIVGSVHDDAIAVLQEARAQALVKHQHICQIYEVCEYKQHIYLVMQYIKGGTLAHFSHQLSLKQKLEVVEKILRGLHQAHTMGIIHRDIKPGNILLEYSSDGELKPYLIDFGIAQRTKQAADGSGCDNFGTPSYMAPELLRANSEHIDRRSDIYSVGVTLHRVIYGQLPNHQSDVINGAKLEVDLPLDLQKLLAKCLAFEPSKRYSSAKALADELKRFIAGEPLLSVTGLAYRCNKKLRKHKLLVALSLTVLLTILSSIGSLLWQEKLQLQREQMLQNFTAKIENMEARVRFVYMAPRHDISEEVHNWQQEIDNLKQQIAALGEPAIGPGHYAIGRMYYALAQYDQALYYLQSAVDSGFEEPRVAYTLAQVHGAIYQQQKSQIDNLPVGRDKKAKLANVDQQHRQVAVRLLEQGISGSPHALLAKAQLLFYQQKPHRALDMIAMAQDLPSWFYQHYVLKGDIYWLLAKQVSGAHQSETSAQYIDKALAYYQQAINIAPSDFQLRLKPTRVLMARLYAILYGGQGNFEQAFTRTLEYLEHCIEVNPQHFQAWFLKGRLLMIKSEYQEQYTGPGVESLQLAVAHLLQAQAKAPDNSTVWLALAMAYSAQYRALQLRGLDGTEQLHHGVEAFENIQPLAQDHYYYNAFGGLLRAQALWLAKHNDQRSLLFFNRALKAYEQASRLKPESIGAWVNGGSVLRLWSEYLEVEEALDKLQQGVLKYQKARELNQQHFVATYYLGVSYRRMAKLANCLFKDNQPWLAKAQQYLQQALVLGKNHPFVVNEIALLEQDQAVYLWQQGLPFQFKLKQSMQRVQQGLLYHPDNMVLNATLAKGYFIGYELHYLKQDPKPELMLQTKQMMTTSLQYSEHNDKQRLMLALLAGSQISKEDINKVEEHSDRYSLLRAFWHSTSEEFDEAELYFAQVKQLYPAMVWLYRYQHLKRWQQYGVEERQAVWLQQQMAMQEQLISEHYPQLLQ